MPSQIYEILSLMMRYWFAALGVLIVLRAFWWLWKDHRSREKKRRSLPDAGSIGNLWSKATAPHSRRIRCCLSRRTGRWAACGAATLLSLRAACRPGIWM